MKATILLFLVLAVVQLSTAAEQLKFVFVTVRGADYEVCDIPGGPKITNKDGKDSKLTEEGKNTVYQLGVKVSELYKSKLGVSKWDSSKNYWPIATNSRRSQISTLITGAGLEGDQSKRDKSWTDEELKKTSFPAMLQFWKFIDPAKCPKFFKEVSQQPEIATTLQDCASQMQEVKKHYDTVDPTKPQHVWLTYETLKKMKKQQPSKVEWASDDMMKKLRECSAKLNWLATTKTDTLRKLSGGLILSDILNDMKEITQGKAQPHATGGTSNKLSLFTTPQGLLIAKLAVFMPPGATLDGKVPTSSEVYPESGATMNTEMYEDNGTWKVKLIYYEGKDYPGKTIKLPGCEEKCPFQQFQQILTKYAVNEQEHETLCKSAQWP
uniref:Acid phosphatase-like protein XcAP-3 n=1 Tax=Xenopsylla cheopis TaxID=163159 RepID=XCAP3_XENCH|nr:secreted salivary acid phosphatase [Xenopsylla cheopis]